MAFMLTIHFKKCYFTHFKGTVSLNFLKTGWIWDIDSMYKILTLLAYYTGYLL